MAGLLSSIGPAQSGGLLSPNWTNWVTPGAPAGLTGVLAQQFDPKELRYQMGSDALTQLGLGLLNPDPRSGNPWVSGLSRGFAGAAQGIQDAQDQFYQRGMQNVQLMELQRQQDERAKHQEALDKIIPTLPPDLQLFAKAFPDQAVEAMMKAKMPGGEAYTLSPGQTRFNGSNRPIATGGPDQPKWTETTLEDGVYRINMQTGEKVKIGDRPNRNEGEGRDFTQENKLRQSYFDQTKPFSDLRTNYQRIQAASHDNTGASDIAMVYSFMKMLDPTSVVREGEFATAQNAGGVDSQIIAMYNKLLSGERLAPQVRKDFLQQAGRQYQEQTKSYGQTREMYKNLAKQYNLDPERVAPDITYGVDLPQPQQIQQGGDGWTTLPNGVRIRQVQ